MLTIKYCKDGESYSDFDLEVSANIIYLKYLLKKHNRYKLDFMEIKVSSENIITCIRMLIAEGKIDNEVVTIEMDGEKTGIDKDGRILNPNINLGEIELEMRFKMLNIRREKAEK